MGFVEKLYERRFASEYYHSYYYYYYKFFILSKWLAAAETNATGPGLLYLEWEKGRRGKWKRKLIRFFISFPFFFPTQPTANPKTTKEKSPWDFHVAFSVDPIVPPTSLFTSQWNTPMLHSQSPNFISCQSARHVTVENVFFPSFSSSWKQYNE